LCSPEKTHVILSEVAVRHVVKGSVPCGAFHRAAFSAKENGFFDCAACGCSAQNDKEKDKEITPNAFTFEALGVISLKCWVPSVVNLSFCSFPAAFRLVLLP